MTKTWNLKPPSKLTPQLARETGITPLQAQLLINRGISDASSALSFLKPRLSNLADPMLLEDMDSAVELILHAIENRENISIYGDYDADGLTSTALLINFFSNLQIPVSFYIPDRLSEGYGLNPEAVKQIITEKGGLMITVDCGTANRKEIGLAIEGGMKVVVTDHHQIPEDFKPICPVINPYRPDSSFPFKDLSGVGTAFFLVVALRTALREKGWFENRPEPDLKSYLDLVAIGTVADVVPILDQNRILVAAGLKIMRYSSWPGINAIQALAGIDKLRVSPQDIAFKIAPRINAAGRMGNAEIGMHILTTERPDIARDLAGQLNIINNRRQSIEVNILSQIEKVIMSMEDLGKRRSLVLSGNGWHEGVLGIVASRIADKYHRPTLIISVKDGMATGSGRSIDGFNLYLALSRLGHLFERFGGHYHAAGFRLEASNIDNLIEGLEAAAREKFGEQIPSPAIEIDGEIYLSRFTMEALDQINSLAPFGPGNPEPIFFTPFIEVLSSKIVGKNHLKLRVKEGGNVMEAIGFGLSEWHPLDGRVIHMVFTPEINRWQGYDRVQLRIVDIKPADNTA